MFPQNFKKIIILSLVAVLAIRLVFLNSAKTSANSTKAIHPENGNVRLLNIPATELSIKCSLGKKNYSLEQPIGDFYLATMIP
jgi:hypothetical protein